MNSTTVLLSWVMIGAGALLLYAAIKGVKPSSIIGTAISTGKLPTSAVKPTATTVVAS